MKCIAVSIAFLLLLVSTAQAETMYVNDIVSITVRTGPSIEHKIVRMLKTGEEVRVVQKGNDWSLIRLADGLEGWVLTRYMTSEKPSSLMVKLLEQKHQQLLEKAQAMTTENEQLKAENKQLSADLETNKNQLADITKRYEVLQKESSDVLTLKAEYEKNATLLEQESQKAKSLNEELLQRNIELFLLGAVVLLIGIIIGLVTKKKKRYSSLLS